MVRFLPLLLTLAFLQAAAADPEAPAVRKAEPEIRGMWVTRFEWPDPNPVTCRNTIRQVMKLLADHNFNTVFFQVRGQCDTLYPSPLEVWSPLLGGEDPGWDPLAFAVEEAHKNGLEFHAHINSHTAWFSRDRKLPKNPEHHFYKHCNIAGHRDWLIQDESGKPAQWGKDGLYVWIAPGVPSFQSHFRRVVLDIVQRYKVDGIHIDRIRLPGPGYSHDPISVARYKGGGNPNHLGFEDWTRDQFTRMLNDVYGAVNAVRPDVKLSVTPVGLYDRSRYPQDSYRQGWQYGRTECAQDAQTWLEAGVVDFAVPQVYWDDDGRKPDFSEVLRDWTSHRADRGIVAGINSDRHSPSQVAAQIEASRKLGAVGQCLFSWTSTPPSELRECLKGPYSHPAPTPEFPWKRAERAGAVVGFVTDGKTNKPVSDVWIRRSGGKGETWLSSGDGFFAVSNLATGSYDLEFKKNGYLTGLARRIQVPTGQTTRLSIQLVRKE